MSTRRPENTEDATRAAAVRLFMLRRLSELGAGVLALASAGLFIAIISFNPADPSLNSSVPRDPTNLLGYAGAWTADIVLQMTGLSGLLFGVVFGGWAWRLGTHQGLGRVWLRLVMLPPCIFLSGIALATLIPPNGWPMGSGLGGVIGDLLFDNLYAAINPLIGTTPAWFGVATAIPALIAWMMAMGLSVADWHQFGQAGLWLAGHGARAGAWAGGRAAALFQRFRRHKRRGDDDPSARGVRRASRTSAKAARPSGAESRVAQRKGKSAGGKRAAAARQPELDFGPPGAYRTPPLDLLDSHETGHATPTVDRDALEQNARLLETVLDDFGVRGNIVKVRPGPVVTLYELEPAPGTKSSRVVGLSDDIARSMSALSVRVAVIPGRNVIGIELPNRSREIVSLRELLASKDFERAAGQLTLSLGKDIGGTPVLVDLSRMPHLLVAGTTGSGKSVAINTMILSILYRMSPEQCRFIMIDPKMLELSVYDGIPHLMSPVVTDPAKAVIALRWAVREMERRYRDMSMLGVRNLAGYNARIDQARKKGESLTRTVQTGFDAETGDAEYEIQELDLEPLPLVVVIVDEMADLMLVAGKEVEMAVQRLAQMARAAGIHLIMATQRPSVDVITGTIKANFPTRVSFQVTSKIDSRTILGESGAEQLLGQGDMLYMAGGGRITRVHGPFVSDEEVERVVTHLRAQGEPRYVEEVTQDADPIEFEVAGSNGDSGDALYDQAVALVCRERKASTSFVQRHLQIGYNRAARIIERMESEGVISAANHVGRREVLARDIDSRVS